MDPILGSIILFAGNFQIRGFWNCDGRLVSIAQNTALFSILGTTYGGDGVTTFALPDLRSRVPVGQGQGPGLHSVSLGEQGGANSVTLTVANMPAHNHPLQVQVQVSTNPAGTDEPAGAFLTATGNNFYATAGSAGNFLGGTSATMGITGGNQPVSLNPPMLGLSYQIAFEGIYPSRN